MLDVSSTTLLSFEMELEKIAGFATNVGESVIGANDTLRAGGKSLGWRRFVPFSQERSAWNSMKGTNKAQHASATDVIKSRRSEALGNMQSPNSIHQRLGTKQLDQMRGMRTSADAESYARSKRVRLASEEDKAAKELAISKAGTNKKIRNVALGAGAIGLAGTGAAYAYNKNQQAKSGY